MNKYNLFLKTSLLCLILATNTSYAAKDGDDDTTEYLPYNEKTVKEWSLIKDDKRHQIKTYSKQEDNRRFRSFKVEGVLNGSLEAAARCQFDIENIPNWYMNVTEAKLLKRVSDTEYYFYFFIKMPFGVPNRDVIIHAKVHPYSSKTGFLGIVYSAAPDFIPTKPGVIRMPAYETSIKLKPAGNNETEEHMEGYVDPGGSGLPVWLVNHIQRRTPYANMLGRKRAITKCITSDTPVQFKYKE
ncbi:START domain-containing protein [Agitococcus lubricus]|uniref:START domain-containing protein n=1 Tax=Agitococcus lubricus TaxID=1077255 RepID=A0A2T5J1P4_9GAMM|nr:START domain-containing protein [Agitococcus lubricus]PTQ90365.1 hypothetical protein C8N29_103118 [Agitococcus lubricus]